MTQILVSVWRWITNFFNFQKESNMGAGAALAVQILMGLLDRAGAIATLINAAQKEKRDITQAELDGLVAADNVARAELEAAIAKAKNTHPTPR